MPPRKPTPERKSRSGSYLPDDLRGAKGGATGKVVVRCSPELAERVRRVSRASGLPLARIMSMGVDAVERMPPRPMTPDEDEAAYRADCEYESYER